MKKLSSFHGLVLPFLLLLLPLTACKEGVHHEESGSYSVTKPWRKSIEIKREYVAQIRAYQHIEIRAFEKGYLQNIYVDEGQHIKKGEKMFQIMPLLMQAEYEKANAEYEIARIEYNNTKNLARKKIVSKSELAMAKAKLEKSKAEQDLAKGHLDMTSISAPFDGIMDRFHVRLGSLIEEGELLTTLSDNSKLWVYFNVSERDYLNYMKFKNDTGKEGVAGLLLANGELYSHPGTIDTIQADFDNETGNVAFRATFPNPEGLLRHGETGNVVLTETLENALVIPQKATFEILDKRFVYVVDEKGKVEAKEIVIEKEVPHLFVVKSGVTEQDTVLLEGLGKVKNGNVIKTKFSQLNDVMKSLELAAN